MLMRPAGPGKTILRPGETRRLRLAKKRILRRVNGSTFAKNENI
jgi:hypothetical protein